MELAGAGHGLGAAGDAQFLVHVPDVGLDGVGRHVQLAGDLAQGKPRQWMERPAADFVHAVHLGSDR